MPSDKKIKEVAALRELVEQASAFYFLDFTGVGVNDFNTTRRRLRDAGAQVRVVKNRLALLAFTESGVSEEVEQFLRGATSVVLTGEDIVTPVRVIKDITRKLEALKFKGAYLDKVFYTAEQFAYLASLPTKSELRVQVVGVLQAPIWELALGLEGLMNEFVFVLDQIKECQADAPAGS
jgi:large subunit ribosomal protein L10